MQTTQTHTAKVQVQPVVPQFRFDPVFQKSRHADLVEVEDGDGKGEDAEQNKNAAPAKDSPAPLPETLRRPGHVKG